ncbi:MAG: phosphatidylglycerophosphatase A [Nevskiaceae bacterium]|nr:MAG: phosphatidylglycerophosphatase A [Nevskiaceae bacterium]
MTEPSRPIPPPPAELILTTPEHLLAYGFGAGLAPRAPGTFGTLVGLPFWFLLSWLSPTPLIYLAGCALLFVAGCWICGESARLLGLHDAPGIVFDEIVGFLVTCVPLCYLAPGRVAWPWLGAAFLLFRFFDILKPWPIRWLDREVHGGLGIMLDDALAAVFAAAVLEILLRMSA